jgi:UPF0755 protein
VIILALGYALMPPRDFPVGQVIAIHENQTLQSIGWQLEDQHIISNDLLFELFARGYGYDRSIVAGNYLFDKKLSLPTLLTQLKNGEHGITEVKVTIPEGLNRHEISERLSAVLPDFRSADFLALTEKEEGYLFPDTYFFYQNATATVVFQAMRDNFDARTKNIRNTFSSETEFRDLVIVASLLEEEGISTEDRKNIAGIIEKRRSIGMPLQLDATFQYINGKASLQLTDEDLQIDSPYNTYRNKGLPPTPISNPGLSSLDAALHPNTTSYLYYLSDKNGNIHYAKNFEEHKVNKSKYIQ